MAPLNASGSSSHCELLRQEFKKAELDGVHAGALIHFQRKDRFYRRPDCSIVSVWRVAQERRAMMKRTWRRTASRECGFSTCFATREARGHHEAEIDRMITDWTQRHDKHEAMRLIGAAGVPAGSVLDTGDLLAEPSFAARGILQTMRHPDGELRMPAFPVRFDGAPAPVKPAPLLGEHNAEVFGEWLGMGADDLDALRTEGVV